MGLSARLAVLLIALSLLVISEGYAGDASKGDPAKGKLIYEGKVYPKVKCFRCHGMTGKGDGPAAEELDPPKPRDFTDKTSKDAITKKTDEQLFKVISEGNKDTAMKGWKDKLTEQEIWDVLAYVRTFNK